MSNAPILRLEGFTGPWKNKKLATLAKRIHSYNISHKLEVKDETGVKSLHYGDIHLLHLDRLSSFENLPNVEDKNYEGLQVGDIIVADASEDLPGLGEACFIVENKAKEKIVAGLHTLALRPYKNIYPDFLFTYLKTIFFKHYIYQVATGLKVYSLAPTSLANFEVKIPDFEEQKGVTKPIKLLDEEISLAKQKKEIFQILQNDFVNNSIISNHHYPKKKLENYIEFKKRTIFPCKLEEKNYHEFSMPAFDKDKKSDVKAGSTMRSTRFILDEACILFNKLNVYKKRIWNLHDIPKDSVSSAEFLPIICKSINQDYLYAILCSEYVTSHVVALSTGSSNSQKRLHPNDLLQLKVPVPDLKEQEKLIKTLKCFNQEIEYINNKIKHLEVLKQYLLKNTLI